MADFRFDAYGPDVARILALDGSGLRPLPLAIVSPGPEHIRATLAGVSAGTLFPHARSPQAALAGLWLYFSFFEESHEVAQNVSAVEGSYWHGILHRQEPDPGNAAYWFRRVGRHPVFDPLLAEAQRIVSGKGSGFAPKSAWDPFAFIDFCESARRRPGSADEETARAIQLAEWQLLFDYCAGPGEPRSRS